MKSATVCMLFGLWAGADHDAQQSIKTDVGPITVHVDCDAQRLRLSDVAQISVTMAAPPHVEIEWPKPRFDPARIRVLDVATDGPDQVGRFKLRLWRIRLEPLVVGKLELGNVQVRYRDSGDWETGPVALPTLEIFPTPGNSLDPATLRPVPQLAGVARDAVWSIGRAVRWLGIAVGVLAIALWAALSRLDGRRVRSPRDEALVALESAEHWSAESESWRERITTICDVVRNYLERAHGLAARARTPAEWQGDEQADKVLSHQTKKLVITLLAAADAARFSRHEPSRADWETCQRLARMVLEEEGEYRSSRRPSSRWRQKP